MKKTINYLRELNPIWFILIFTSLGIMETVSISTILEFLNIPNHIINEVPPDYGFIEMLFLTVIFAPIIETLFHQLLPYWLLSKIRYFRKNPIWIILISALSFAVIHYYSIHYMISTFISGVLFICAYILRNKKYPYWTVVAIHALINLFVTIYNFSY